MQLIDKIDGAPRGLGDLGRMAIYFHGAGGTGNYFQGFGEQAHNLGDLGSPAKKYKKNLTLKEKPSFHMIFFKKIFGFLRKAPRPPFANLNAFTFVLTC